MAPDEAFWLGTGTVTDGYLSGVAKPHHEPVKKDSAPDMDMPGQGRFSIMIVDSANSETLPTFLDTVRERTPKIAVIMDNVSYHKPVSTTQ